MCDNFSRELVKVVVAQIAQAVGFHSVSQGACEAIADILQLYIEELGYSSHLYAEHATRTESNFHDISSSFEDMGISISELFTFVTQFEEIPFAKAVPPFPLPKKETPHPPDLADKEELPHPDLYSERITDPRMLRRAKSKQKRQLEKSLYDLSTKMGAKPVASYEELIQQRANPFLAPPKQAKSHLSKSADIPTPPQSDKHMHDDIDDFERQKKRAKVEKILSLSHQDGIVESLDMPGSNAADKDKDDKIMSP